MTPGKLLTDKIKRKGGEWENKTGGKWERQENTVCCRRVLTEVHIVAKGLAKTVGREAERRVKQNH